MNLNVNLSTITDNVKKQNTNELDDDYVVKSMGAFGKWQLIFCVICTMSRVITTWNVMSVLFLTPNTEFMCVEFTNNTREAENSTCYHDCKAYFYYNEIFNKSVISEYDLICDRAWLASLVQTVLMLGLVFGISCFGCISDRFGRSKTLIISTFANVTFMVAISFSTDYRTFIVLRFLIGFTSGGIMTISTVFILEMVGQKYRELGGTLVILFDGPSESILSLIAYYTHTWNDYMLSYAGMSVVIFLMLLSIPETPRWLLVNGKLEETVELMTKAAKFNKLPTSRIKDHVKTAYQELKMKESKAWNVIFRNIFRTKELSLITIRSIIVWFVAGVSFYGIHQYVSILGTNLYVVVAILGLTQLLAYPITMTMMKLMRRIHSIIATNITISISLIILIFVPDNSWVSTTLGIIGATASCTNFAILYIYVTELYPTPIRNTGFGVSSSASKCGAMVAPFIATINPSWTVSLIFAVLPVVAVGFCFILPETKGRVLEDNLE